MAGPKALAVLMPGAAGALAASRSAPTWEAEREGDWGGGSRGGGVTWEAQEGSRGGAGVGVGHRNTGGAGMLTANESEQTPNSVPPQPG